MKQLNNKFQSFFTTLLLLAAFFIPVTNIVAQPTPPSVPISGNAIGGTEKIQTGFILSYGQGILAYADPVDTITYNWGGCCGNPDPSFRAILSGKKVAWVTSAPQSPPGSYIPWFMARVEGYRDWYATTTKYTVPFATFGYEKLFLDLQDAWIGLPVWSNTPASAYINVAWGNGDLWYMVWDIPPSGNLMGLMICAQWMRVDQLGSYLSNSYCFRIF